MQQKIGSRSTAKFASNEATLTVKRGFGTSLLFASISSAVFASFMYNKEGETNFSFSNLKMHSVTVVIFLIVAVSVYSLFRNLFYKERYRIDLANCMLYKEDILFSWVIKTSTKQWNKDSYFKYENEYDSYENVTNVWLVVSSKEKKESKRLIRFFDKNTFLQFRKLFNEKFPKHTILEWHD